MSLFGNRIFADIISISKVPIDLCGVGCVTTIVTVLIRSRKFGESREDHVKMEAVFFKPSPGFILQLTQCIRSFRLL